MCMIVCITISVSIFLSDINLRDELFFKALILPSLFFLALYLKQVILPPPYSFHHSLYIHYLSLFPFPSASLSIHLLSPPLLPLSPPTWF